MDTLAVRLTLPTTKRVVDFHHQAIAHGGRTIIGTAPNENLALCRCCLKGRMQVQKWQVIKQSLPSLHRSEALSFIPA
jgi:hypothetical protein